MMLKIIFLCLTMSLTAQASTDPWFEKGNGGFGISCQNMDLTSLDLFEARSRYGLILDQNSIQSVDERVTHLLSKLARLNPRRASIYLQWYKEFPSDSAFIKNFEDPIPDDFGTVFLPIGCNSIPIIIQRPRSRTD